MRISPETVRRYRRNLEDLLEFGQEIKGFLMMVQDNLEGTDDDKRTGAKGDAAPPTAGDLSQGSLGPGQGLQHKEGRRLKNAKKEVKEEGQQVSPP